MLKEGGSRLSFLLPRFVVYFYRLSRAIFWYVLMYLILVNRVQQFVGDAFAGPANSALFVFMFGCAYTEVQPAPLFV